MFGIPAECLGWFMSGFIAGGLLGLVAVVRLAMRK